MSQFEREVRVKRLIGPVAAAIVIMLAMTTRAAGAEDSTAAERTYRMFCAECHGRTGHGNGPGAPLLKVKPRDFSDCARMTKLADDELFEAIKEGGAAVGRSKDMLAWKEGFDDSEIRGLVSYLRTFCKSK
jgi:cytochrome c oxidase cbb3-type subunit III